MQMTLRDRHILVIEDAADVRDVFVMLLRAEGAAVVASATGREGLTAFHNGRFDVVITDLGLPDISGDLLIRTIIAAARHPVTVVVISGDSEAAMSRAVKAGATVIFTKPCHWEDVLTYLERLSLAPAA